MINLIKVDLKRFVFSYRFLISLLLYFFVLLLQMYEIEEFGLSINEWGSLNIFMNTVLFSALISGIIAPIIAVIPFSDALYGDLRCGYAKAIAVRCGVTNFFVGRSISTVISGILPFLLVQVIILIIAGVLSTVPSFRFFTVAAESPFASIYEQSMLGYTIAIIINSCIFGASYALFGMSISFLTGNRFVGLIVPAIVYILGTATYGLPIIFDFPILPFSTFRFYSTLPEFLIKDHIEIIVLSIVFLWVGFRKWKTAWN